MQSKISEKENEKSVLNQEIAIAEALLAEKDLQVTKVYGSAAKKLKIANYVDNEESRNQVIK